ASEGNAVPGGPEASAALIGSSAPAMGSARSASETYRRTLTLSMLVMKNPFYLVVPGFVRPARSTRSGGIESQGDGEVNSRFAAGDYDDRAQAFCHLRLGGYPISS